MMDLINIVRKLCEQEGVEFLFLTNGKSCWSVEHDRHIKEVVDFHKDTENRYDSARRDFYDLS